NGFGINLVYGSLQNNAGGVISGSVTAITGSFGHITNAGTINGNVDFTGAPSYLSSTYVDNGGTVNGNLLFGAGNDTLFEDLSLSANGRVAGVTGTVDGGGGTNQLIMHVGANTDSQVASVTNFQRVE